MLVNIGSLDFWSVRLENLFLGEYKFRNQLITNSGSRLGRSQGGGGTGRDRPTPFYEFFFCLINHTIQLARGILYAGLRHNYNNSVKWHMSIAIWERTLYMVITETVTPAFDTTPPNSQTETFLNAYCHEEFSWRWTWKTRSLNGCWHRQILPWDDYI